MTFSAKKYFNRFLISSFKLRREGGREGARGQVSLPLLIVLRPDQDAGRDPAGLPKNRGLWVTRCLRTNGPR